MAHELDWRSPDRFKGFCLLTCPVFRVFGVSGFVGSPAAVPLGDSRAVAAKLNLLCGR